MAKETLKVIGARNGKNITTTITDVNPAATNAQLASLGTKFTALTTNVYQETNRVTTVNCDTEPGGGVKPAPTLTLDKYSLPASSISNVNAGNICTATTNSDGQLYAVSKGEPSSMVMLGVIGTAIVGRQGTAAVTAQTLKIGVTETENFAGLEVEFQITA